MKLILAAAVSVTVILPNPIIAQPVPFTNLGEGTTTCGEWLDKRKATPERVLPEGAWTLGYVTAASRFRARGTSDLSHGIEGSAVDHWLDNYCALHPLDEIQTAADLLVRELITRSR